MMPDPSLAHTADDASQPPCAPRVGVIYNPRSHRNKGREPAVPTHPCIEVARPSTKPEIAMALRRFAADGIDYLVISGGDGTVRDVLTMGYGVFGDDWPVLAVLPRGKTNALNADIAAPQAWRLEDAVAAYDSGRRVSRRPIVVRGESDTGEAMLGFILGAGIYAEGVRSGQDAHRLGLFDSLAVGLTSAWGIAQTLIGRNSSKWRRGTEMALHCLPGGAPIDYARRADRGRRSLLLASTLQRMPLGLKLFGPWQGGIRMLILDRARRRVMAFVPAMLAGWHPGWLRRAGLHQITVEGFAMEIAEGFVLDGESFAAGAYTVTQGPELTFVTT